MRRIFEDEQGNKIDQLDLWDYGYDARKRVWYRDTMQADRALVASFSIGTPMITLSAPLQRQVRGVVAADLKLDKFSDLVYAQRPGEHGTAIIFDSFGVLIAHPEFARLVDYAMTLARITAALPPIDPTVRHRSSFFTLSKRIADGDPPVPRRDPAE
jgi:adenylate cyclase